MSAEPIPQAENETAKKRPNPPLRYKISRHQYNALIAGFRIHGPHFAKVAATAGCHWTTAKRAWEQGYPHMRLEPIKPIIELEELDGRAKLRDLEQQKVEAEVEKRRHQAEKAREDFVSSRVQEALMVRSIRTEVIGAAAALAPALHAAKAVGEAMLRKTTGPELKRLSLKDGALVLQRMASSVRTLSQAQLGVQVAERALLGGGTVSEAELEAASQADASAEMTDLDATAKELAEQAAIMQRHADRKLQALRADGSTGAERPLPNRSRRPRSK